MSYTKTEWKTGDIITAERMNKLEEGVSQLSETIEENSKDIEKLKLAGGASVGVDVVYPLQRSSYYDKLTAQIQDKANNATKISTDNHLAHAIRGCAGNRILCLLFGENNVENDKSTDTSDTSGKWHMKCKLYLSKALAGGLFDWNNDYCSTDVFDVFGAGETVYDVEGTSLGTIVSSSDGVTSRAYGSSEDLEGFFHLNALCVLDTGDKVAVHRTITATYTVDSSGGSISYELTDITTLSLTVDGVTGANDLSRIDSTFNGQAFSGCGYQYNPADKKHYLAKVQNSYGVVILSTSDFVNHEYVAFYAYDKAYIECSLYFDNSWVSQTYKTGVFLACRSVYGHEYVRLAKLDYNNNYIVLDEVDLPATTAMPCFSSSMNNDVDDNIYFAVSDYNRNRASIYKIIQKNIRQLKPIAVIEMKCCNYISLINLGFSVFNRKVGDFIICGTNGTADDFGGVSWFYENLTYDYYDFGNNSSFDFQVATSETLGGVKPVAKTDEMTQEVGIDENGALWTKKSSSVTGSVNDGTYAETQLASGEFSTDYQSGTVVKTGITLESLRSYKIFGVRWKGESNTGLNNTRLYLYDSDSEYITLDIIGAGYEVVFEWVDSEKTVLRPIQLFNGNSNYVSDIGTSFIRKATAGNKLCSGQGTSMQINGWALVDSLTDKAELALVSYSTPIITYSWEVRGLIK